VIPLVILDLDGTVIGASGQVVPSIWEAAEAARAAGVKISVCTGRPGLGVALRVARRLGPNVPHVFQSGAHLAFPDGETLMASSLREAAALKLVQHAREVGLVLELYTPHNMYVERRTSMSEAHAAMIGVGALVRDLAEVAQIEPVIRAQWVLTEDQEPLAMRLTLTDVQVSRATSPAQPGTLFVSLTRRGTSKGSAVEALCAHLKIAPERVMAVGDSAGDIPMLERVGYPLVVGNADPALLQRYPVIGDAEDGGVVEALAMAVRGPGAVPTARFG
jgi:Cof subfamily protein (haloacid dehalogenase superfamily)